METKETPARLVFNEIDHRYEGKDHVVAVVVNESTFHAELAAYLRKNPSQGTEQAKATLYEVAYWHDFVGKGSGVSVVPISIIEARRHQASPRLFRGQDDYWRGHDDDFMVTLSHDAFNQEVKAHLRRQDCIAPDPAQLVAAQQVVMQVKYWHGAVSRDGVTVVAAKKRGDDADL